MNKRILGIIGALLGGFIFTIPWILLYVYGKMLFSVLAAFIAFGALLGYKKFGGVVDKKTPIIIVVVSLIVIVVTTLIIIPLCLLYREGYIVSWHNLEFIYNNDQQFKSGIIMDLIVSIFFTMLGISGVISKLKQEVDPNYVPTQNANIANNQANIEKVKKAFLKYHAMDKFSATSKENILNAMDNDTKAFNQLKMQQIIKKYRGNYYFSEKAEKSLLYRFAILYIKIMGIILVCGIAIALIFILK